MCLSIGDSTVEGTEEEEDAIVVGQYYVTLFVEGSVDTWYISSCEGDNGDGTYKMHQLTNSCTNSCTNSSDLLWKQSL